MNNNPFLQYPDLLENRQRVRAILLDFFLDKKVNANVLVAAYDSGIALAIKNSKVVDNTFVLRFEKILINDFAIQPKMAKWSVLYWIEMYGSQVLGKDIAISDTMSNDEDCAITDNSIEDNELPLDTQTVDHQQSSNISSGIIIEEMHEGDKIPKSVIDINMESFKKFGISNITCILRKGYTGDYETCYDITGKYEGKSQKNIIMMIMSYNNSGEMIGTDFNEVINDDFIGSKSYSTSMYVPNWETVAKVEVKAALNPALIW